METKVKNNKPLSELISDIEKNADLILQNSDPSLQIAAMEIKNSSTRIQASFIGLRMILWISFAFLLLAIFVTFTFYESNNNIQALNNQLIESAKPSSSDTLMDKILLNPKGSLIYREDANGNPISYQALLVENDSLRERLDAAIETYGITINNSEKDGKKFLELSSTSVDKLQKENTKMIKLLEEIKNTLEGPKKSKK